MQIDSSNRTPALTGTTTPTTVRSDTPAAKPSGAQDSVQISSLSTQIQALESGIGQASGFDTSKVEAVKQTLNEGRFAINADTIADKLISSTRELLAKQG